MAAKAEKNWKAGRPNGRADRHAEKRPGTRGGDDGGQHSGEKRTRQAVFRLQRTADRSGGGSHFKDAEHVECEHEHQQHQREHDPRILELIAPADGGAGGEEKCR